MRGLDLRDACAVAAPPVPTAQTPAPAGLPASIWDENTPFIPETPTGNQLEADDFTNAIYRAASHNGPSGLTLRMRALDVEAAGAVVTAILDDCRRRGDYSTNLVPPRDRNVGLESPASAVGPGVEREIWWSYWRGLPTGQLLTPTEDGYSTLRPLYSSPDIPVPAARLELLERVGATAALLLVQGQYPAPLDPAIFQFYIHGGNLHALHPSFMGEWHPNRRQDINNWLALGIHDDITPFQSLLINHLNTSPAAFQTRSLEVHLAVAPDLLYRSTLGSANFQHPEWQAFSKGFDLRCANGFTFPSTIQRFQGGSEAFLSLISSSYMSGPNDLLSNVEFVMPPGYSQWSTMLATRIPGGNITFIALFVDFLRGSGIPCPQLFQQVTGSFSPLIDLSRIGTPGFRSQMVAWASTGSPLIHPDNPRITV
ncbi:hypothetical protein B0H13DRAFT_2302393 [Mycena leptocephala]|nr:hypothetical protein B0H13DRAFT_2302393 [Mycena leptocephala]